MEAAVVRVPELRFAQSGKAWMTMRVVAKDRRRGANGQWEDGDATFLDVIAFDKQAENIAETITETGTTVLVVGDLEQHEYEKDGEKRTVYRVRLGFDGGVAPSTRWNAWSKSGAASRSTTTPTDDPWASNAQEEPPF
jgi:single-strand DNA-binding protein